MKGARSRAVTESTSRTVTRVQKARAVSYRRPKFPEDHFLRLPNAWARDGQLRPNAKAMLMSILSHDPGYELSTAQLMRETGLGRDAIQAATRHMLERGYLEEVRQSRASGSGKWGGNDYLVTDCVGVPAPPAATADPDLFDGNLRIDPLRSDPAPGDPVPAEPGPGSPARKKNPGEKNTPVPTGQGARHLSPVQTAQQRAAAEAQVLTKEHYDASGGLARFPAVLSIVKRALSATDDSGAARWNADAVRLALTLLRESGRPVTLETLRAALTTPQGVRRGGYGAAPYRNPDPTTQPDAFSGSF